MITFIRKSKLLSLFYASFMGLIFRFCFGLIKNLLWSRAFDFISLDISTPRSLIFALVLFVNFITDFTSSLIAAILPGFLLFYVMRKSAVRYSLPAILVFLAVNSGLWKFWQAPHLETKISLLIGPFLEAFVFLAVVWLFQKYLIKRMGNGDGNFADVGSYGA